MFEHLKKLEVRDATSWIDLPELPSSSLARLLIKPMGESNQPFYNAMLRMSGSRKRLMLARGSEVDTEFMEQNRQDDRELFPLYIIADWEGVEDEDGNVVPYSRDACKELCAQLPHWSFDRIRNHAATPERFLGEDEEPLPDPEELVGN